jgi:predicted negative regulator of RcsB-dependent stress response
MVDEYSSDLEQEEALRNWWKENWRWVSSGIVLGLALLGGWQYWQHRTQQHAEAAAHAYADFATAIGSGDKTKIDALAKDLDTQYADSPYADQAHFALAQSYVATNKFEQAASELKAVVDKSKDAALVQIARLRLARVQQQLGHYEEALALLDVTKAGAFAAQMQEVRGDILLAKGDSSGARLAYETAISERVGKESAPGESELLSLKLQDLGAAEVATTAKTAEVAPLAK